MERPEIEYPKGSVGLWECPALKTQSWLYQSPVNNTANNQKIVDRDDCALWWKYGKGYAVIDHADSEVGEGSWNVNRMRVDDLATRTTPDGKSYYICIAVVVGTRRKYNYAYEGKTFAPTKKGDVVCISCANEDGSQVYLAYYRLITTITYSKLK